MNEAKKGMYSLFNKMDILIFCVFHLSPTTGLLLGRKVMTKLDSIFQSRDITLLTKVCLVKTMVFPVVMYGCESWTVKKAECRRIDAFELWCCPLEWTETFGGLLEWWRNPMSSSRLYC